MSYTVYFTDPTKYSSALVIEDNVLNTVQTSLTFVGKNASNYSSAISTNFLHLLENHANTLPPNNPIEGQLWYDSGTNKLKINDGTSSGANWKSINGVYQETEEPSAAVTGDIWVDTISFQIKVKNAEGDWVLVGPSLDGGTKSGSIPETVNDTFGNPHTIISNYLDGQIVEIISAEQFTPQIKIDGFDIIKAGLNVTSTNGAILNATSYASQNILVTTPIRSYVNGNYFVRNDIDNSISGILNAKSGITIGIDPTFIIQKEGTFKNKFVNAVDGGSFVFQVIKDEIYNDLLIIDGNTKRVGINNANPQVALDVTGSARFSGTVTITTNADDALIITGSASFGRAVTMSSTATFATSATFSSGMYVGKSSDVLYTTKQIITPALNRTYTIGSTSTAFKEVHATSFVGNLVGNIYGAGGVADKAKELTTTATITIAGDIASAGIQYSGKGDPKQFSTTLQTQAITSRNTVTSVSTDDELLVAVKPVNYTDIPVAGGSGNGATFDLRREDGIYVNLEINNTGTNYAANDLLTISGTYLGGTSVNDIIIQVNSVNVIGSITSSTKVSGVAVSGLNKTTKEGFLSDVLDYLIPAGTIVPYAGLDVPNPATTLSPGWLFCDGSVVSKSEYPRLFSAIGYIYGKTLVNGQFRLPDLRGRTLIGYDDMSNGFVSSGGVANRVVGANTPPSSAVSAGTTPPVTGGSTTATSTASYSAQYPTRPIAGFGGTSTGLISTVMNPYLAINYIIKA
jgi:microcystin-dependent protein